MSEEILKALTQLFAIITKQDGGVSDRERGFVIRFFKEELDQDTVREYLELYDKSVGFSRSNEKNDDDEKEKKLTSVKDSVKTLGICKKINKTLAQKQKVLVLLKILELVASDKKFTPQRMQIIDTISSVFNIGKEEFKLIESFVLCENSERLPYEDLISVNARKENAKIKQIYAELDGEILFMKVKSIDMYYVKYLGNDQVVLNGFIMKPNRVYLYSHGSTIKTPKGNALYYSDITSQFQAKFDAQHISFNANNIEFKFPNGTIGLHDINISEGPGKLIGIMGASGSGKTTLLNVLAGIETPSKGEVLINGYNIHTEKEKIQGVIGYVAQDDILIEELTVYQNLYYNAKLCFAKMGEEELHKRVINVLENLGLEHRKDLKVGNVLDKTISGGQRKRLNIALELIREPAVLFVDEPTSGLSSRDSENVIDLLKELSLKGKLIFVVIHQPSSDIYKIFDKMFLLDEGGLPIFYGHPVQAVTYFKKSTNQVDSERGQCPTCGNVNPEQIFNIIEAKVVDEYGQFTNKRKVNPQQWHENYIKRFRVEKVEDVKEAPPKALEIPSKIKQTTIFTIRDFLAKISNKQYLFINLLEAPLLAAILAFIIKYRNAPNGKEYIFRFNDNIPAFLLMSIIVALFMGLTVSAEEIIRDRKILKRESFLNLSWNSYLQSKLTILFLLSAIQTFSFTLIGIWILEIKGMTLYFWLVLFTVSCFANILGLNISATFKSAVTVYVLIPLLLIPQMILSGLLFPYDKLNNLIITKGKVPVIADLMASRWAFEAMSVQQFKENAYQKPLFDIEKEEKTADFKTAFLIPKLKEKLTYIYENQDSKKEEIKNQIRINRNIIINEIKQEPYKKGLEKLNLNIINESKITPEIFQAIIQYFDALDQHYAQKFNVASTKKDKFLNYITLRKAPNKNLESYQNIYFNESMSDLVRNISTKNRLLEYKGKLIQQIDPIYQSPKPKTNPLNYRTHFFAPEKYFLGTYIDTSFFNLIVIWFMTATLYAMLYWGVFKKIMSIFENIRIR